MIEFLEMNIEFETKLLDRARLQFGIFSKAYIHKKQQVDALVHQLNNSRKLLAS